MNKLQHVRHGLKAVGYAGCFVALVAGCAGPPEPVRSAAIEIEQASPSLSAPASFDPGEVARWVQFRKTYGLRFDLLRILQVAGDPSIFNEMSVPLTQAEIDQVATLNLGIQNLAPALQQYGESFPGEYAGVFIEGTRVVIQFTGRLDEHRAAITTLFGQNAPIEVRSTNHAVRDLEALAQQVEAQRAWFPSVGAELFGASANELDNKVRVRYIAMDEAVEPLILAHFGNPEWMQLKWYGPPPWTGPEGTLRVTVVERDGRPVDAQVYPVPMDHAVRDDEFPLPCGRDGICEFQRMPAVDWELTISFQNMKDENIDIRRRVHVSGNRTTSVTYVVDR